MKVHFVAIGGSIMHSLAITLKKNGHEVSGSDDQIFDPARSRLRAHDLLPEDGWHPQRIREDLDAVILGMHAFKDNPELAKAQKLGLPVYSFPEFISQQSEHKQRIVIAGSAGKTTITSMVMHVLKTMGRDFDYLVGAQIPGFDNPVSLSDSSPFIVIEGDEYLSSRIDPKPKFLHYKPHILVISNISWDHINVFPTEDNYISQFESLLKQMEKAGSIIYFKEDQRLSHLVEQNTDPELHYLYPYELPAYDIVPEGFRLTMGDESALLKVIGRHNMANIEAAWKVCELLSVPAEDFLRHIATFQGAGIRLEVLQEKENMVLIRDYAHAPSKVAASVDAVRKRFPQKNLIACFELHTFSSLNRAFLPHYLGSLNQADQALVFLDPEALRKRRMDSIEREFIQKSFGADNLTVVHTPEEVQKFVKSRQSDDDVILMMSSGNFAGLDIGTLA